MDILSLPAFLATEAAELLYLNEPMRRLCGQREAQPENRTLLGLGLFVNAAEYRGFLKGFQRVGPVQRLQLPGNRLRDPSIRVTLTATLLDSDNLVLGVVESNAGSGEVKPQRLLPVDSTMDLLPYYVVWADGRGTLLRGNEAFRIAFRCAHPLPIDRCGNMSDLDINFTPARWEDHIRTARSRGLSSYNTKLRMPDGAQLPVRVTISGVEGTPARSAVVSMVDLTQFRPPAPAGKLLAPSREQPAGVAAIISEDPAYQEVLDRIHQVADTGSTVLITGETGTGKELVARALHYHSRRRDAQFITVNCGALPAELIESELFGYRKGAFTGANQHRTGLVEAADGGTLFLDEIGELPLGAQTKLLRVLQEREYTPVGSSVVRTTTARIIAATNQDLQQMVAAGTFRADLYFRLNIFPIHNPPLRDRPGDVLPLAEHFLHKHAPRINPTVRRFSPGSQRFLRTYSFPGNVRELQNLVERALILATGEELDLVAAARIAKPTTDSVAPTEGQPAPAIEEAGELLSLVDMERRHIEHALNRTGGKVSGPGGAAELLAVNAQTLYSKIRKLGIARK